MPSPNARTSAARRPESLGLGPQLEAAGFNVAGVLSVADYDGRVPHAWRTAALQPEARSVVVLACGGRAFGAALRASLPPGTRRLPAPDRDPVDRYTRQVVDRAADALMRDGFFSRAVFAGKPRGGGFADFVALGHACGLGHPSRLGLLLHPEYGPWLAIRALLLTARELPATPPLEGEGACTGCPAPCASACPGGAPRASGFDLGACTRTRQHEPGCALRCAARRACVIGTQHAYDPELEAHHMRAAAVWAV